MEAMNKREIGVAVVGLGIGEQHVYGYERQLRCHVRLLLDHNIEKANELASKLPNCFVARSYEEILKSKDIKIISIASYDNDHFQQVIDALHAGKHVFVEKPICRTMTELQQIKAVWLANDKKLRLRSNLVLRASPLYKWLKDIILNGNMGNLYSFDADYLYGRLNKITEGWRNQSENYSVMEGGGIHMVDLMLWLNQVRPHAVTASSNKICTMGTKFRYADYMAATFEYSSGLISRVTANFGCVHRHHHAMRVFGTEATFIYDDQGARMHSSRDPLAPVEKIDKAPLPASKGDLIPDFIASVLNDVDDTNETQGFFDALSVCIAADRAAETGNKERIDYV